MKANELMVGDWVRVKAPYFKKNKAYRVVEVREHGYNGEATANIELPDEDEEASMTGEYIIGIPITPEILEKNGFKKLGFDGWEFDYVTEGGCLIYEVLWRCDYPKEYHTHLTIKSYSPDFGSFKSFRIDSVHELQNALRLCGIEKEIEI